MPSSRAAGRLRLVDDSRPTGATGYGTCPARHGELLRGAFWLHGAHRPPTRAAVGLPYPELSASATAELLPDRAIDVHPETKTRSLLAARLTLAELRIPGGVRVSVTSDIPAGLGGSTADITATVRAVAAAAGRALPPATIARIAGAVEPASSGVMFGPEATLFAYREGRAVGTLGPALPALLVVGCAMAPVGAADRDYTPGETDQLGLLLAMLRRAVRTEDARLLGAVASQSAAINQHPFLAELNQVAGTSEAVGVQVAHSGGVAGLLYDAADPRAAHLADRGRAALDRLGVGRTWAFVSQPATPLVRAVGQ